MKVTIDQEECVGCGACEESCAEIFAFEAGAQARIKTNYQTNGLFEGEIPDELLSCAQDPAESCPIEAIRVTR